MGRPPKSKAERKDTDLRIPVTAEQKKPLLERRNWRSQDMAAWARPILLQAAMDGKQGNRREN